MIRYAMTAAGRSVPITVGSYVGALVEARNAALADPGIQHILTRNGEEIARYTAKGGRIVEARLL